MRPYRFYMHPKNMDVCFKVIKSFRLPNGTYKLKVDWINLGYAGKPFLCYSGDKFKLLNAKEWVDITHIYANKRSKPGLPQ